MWIKESNKTKFLDIASTFTCDDGKVLDASKQCDDYPDCLYGEDEQDCQYDEELTDLEYDEDVVEENTGNWTIVSYLKLWDNLEYNKFLFFFRILIYFLNWYKNMTKMTKNMNLRKKR